MPKIYEYFGFVFYFYSNDHEPIHVHARLSGRETIFELIIENGELAETRKRYKQGLEPLRPDEETEAIEFVETFFKNIIAKWVRFFVMKQRVNCTIITKRIKRKLK